MTAYKPTEQRTGHPLVVRLVQARKDANLSQETLAWRLGIAQATLSRWETGTRDVGLYGLTDWCAALGLELQAGEPQIPDGPLPELIAGGLA